MAERDGGSSFVVSPRHQLYRLHVSQLVSHSLKSIFTTSNMSWSSLAATRRALVKIKYINEKVRPSGNVF